MATYFFICLLVFYQATILWANTEFPSKVPPTQTDDFNDRKSASEDSFNDDDDYNDDNGPNDMDNEVLTNITTKMDVVSTTSSSSSSIMTDDSTEFTKSTPAPMSKVNAVSNKNFLQELLLLSTSWTEVQRQLQLLNKHLDGIKSAFIRYETNVKEELVAIQEDIQSLKATSGELETDLQTVSETLERIQDWTSNVDKKFLTLEKFMHNERKSKKRHQDNSEICMRCGKIHKKKKLINDFQTKTETRSSVDFIQKPQADSEATASQQISSLKYSDNKCDVNMKDGIQMLKDHCSAMCRPKPSSCADIQRLESKNSGIYPINPLITGFDSYLKVNCDLHSHGGGWTVIQRRNDYGLPRENFSRSWVDYKKGFGDLSKEFWLGNDAIFALTNQEPVILRVELETFEGEVKYAEYNNFRIGNEKEHYQLDIGAYSGNAADSLGRSRHMLFSTQDSDNDKWTGNCARRFEGGWWFNNCHDANLNGFYYGGVHESYADGINWYHWKGFHYSLKRTELKIRPQWFNNNFLNSSKYNV